MFCQILLAHKISACQRGIGRRNEGIPIINDINGAVGYRHILLQDIINTVLAEIHSHISRGVAGVGIGDFADISQFPVQMCIRDSPRAAP